MRRWFRGLSIRWRLTAGYAVVLLAALALEGVTVYVPMRRSITSSIEESLELATKQILSTVETSASTSVRNHLRAKAESSRHIVEDLWRRAESGEFSEQEARSRAVATLLSQKVGSTGYIYCLDSSGTLRVHPVEALVGQDVSANGFVQRQTALREGYIEYDWANPGEPAPKPKALYMTYFEPWDWIVSVSSYREEFAELVTVSDFRDAVLAHSLGPTGYSFVITSEGDLVLHPQREGENILNETDASGRRFMEEMCRAKRGRIRYPWRNPGEAEPREKIVCFDYFPEFDWIVASSVYVDEIEKPLRVLTYAMAGTAAVTVLLVFAVTAAVSASITRPLDRLIGALARGAEGDLDERLDAQAGGELGLLARYYNQFMDALRDSRARLQASEANYRRLFESAVEGVFQTTPEGRFLSANPSFAAMLGYDGPEAMLALVTDIRSQIYADPQDRDRLLALLEAEGVVEAFETRFVRADGAVVPVSVSVRLVRDEAGLVTRLEGFAADITERTRAEEERRRFESEIHRTQRLESLGVLAGGIAHDFNNILGAVTGYTELALLHPEVPEAVRENMRQVLTGALRAKDLVTQILAFSRKADMEPRMLEVGPLIQEAARFLRASLPATIEMRCRIDDGCLPIVADPTKIHQVIVNLCTNAHHAMRDAGGVLAIEAAPAVLDAEAAERLGCRRAGPHVRLTVSDTGCGMTPEVRERALEPFYTTKPPGEGTGLGLSTVHGIVAGHGGAVSLFSEEGQGAAVSVYLPCAAEEGLAPDADLTAPAPRGDERVLVVDDESAMAKLACDMLTLLGYRADQETDPQRACERLRHDPSAYDILVTDSIMPRLTGLELVSEARRIGAKLPVVIVSGLGQGLAPERLKSLGVSTVVRKPYTLRELAVAVRDALDET